MYSLACSPSWNPNYPLCVNKIYFQAMHEIIKIDNDQKYLMYSNLKTKKFNIPIIWNGNTATNSMDMFVITKTDWTLEVFMSFFFRLNFEIKTFTYICKRFQQIMAH